MKSIIALLLISFALLSCVEGAFVFDRRLLNTTRGRRVARDFTGSIRYGTFSYLGACPTGSGSGLSYIKLSKVGVSGSAATCFTNAINGAVPSIGYICEPTSGGSGIIHFGYPGSDGFVIGGAFFGGAGAQDTITGSGATSFVWGGVGAPSYSGEVTGTCSASCAANYCSSSCSASCVATATASSGSVSCSTNTGTGQGSVYFVPSGTNAAFSNCGSLGTCCTSENLFSYCKSESLITGTYATTYSATPTAPEANAEYGISFIPSTGGIIAGVTYNAGSTTITQRLVTIWKNGVQSTQFNSASGSGLLRTMLATAVSVSSGDNIMVSFPVTTSDPSSPYSSFTPGNTITNNRFLTSSGPFYSLTSGAIPDQPYDQLAALDIIFNPCA